MAHGGDMASPGPHSSARSWVEQSGLLLWLVSPMSQIRNGSRQGHAHICGAPRRVTGQERNQRGG